MAWKYRTVINRYTGFPVQERYWVPDVVSGVKKAGGGATAAAAAKRRADAAKKRADEAAKKAADARAKQAAKRQQWQELKHSTSKIMKNLGRPMTRPSGAPMAVGGGTIQGGVWVPPPSSAAKPAFGSTSSPWVSPWGPGRDLTPQEKQQRDAALRAQQKKREDKAALTAWKPKGGVDKQTAKIAEQVLKEAREGQVKSGGKSLDTEVVLLAQNTLNKYGLYVSTKMGHYADKVDALYKKDKDGNVIGYKDPNGYQKAMAITKDAEFIEFQHEYNRLFGEQRRIRPDGSKGKDIPHSSNYEVAMTAARQIADSQRTYIRDAAKEVFFKGSWVQGPNAHFETQRQWDEGEKWLYEATIDDIDPLKTSMVHDVDKKTGKVTIRHRTPEEEYLHMQGQYEAEMRRQYEEYKKYQAMQEAKKIGDAMYKEHLQRMPGYEEEQKRIGDLAAASKALGVSEKGPTTQVEMTRVVNFALEKWKKDNAARFQTTFSALEGKDTTGGGLSVLGGTGSMGLSSGSTSMRITDQTTKWADAVERQRQLYYRVFNSEAPFDIDQLGIPFVKPALQVLGGVASLPLVLGRLEMAAGGNLFTGGGLTNPMNTSKFGGVEPTSDQAPKHIQDMMMAASKQVTGGGGYYRQGGGVAAGKVYADWLKTAEGKKWYGEQWSENRRESAQEDAEFMAGIYGPGSVWEKLDALTAYGGAPTRNELANFALSVVTDPTAAFPLKFTTWLSRLDHARQVTQGMSKVRRLGVGILEFQKVNEPQLRLTKALMEVEGLLKSGESAPKVAEKILTELAGIVDGPNRAKETKKLFQKWGIDPESTNGKLIMSQAQESILRHFAEAGIDYKDIAKQAQEVEHATRKRLADEAAAKVPHLDVAEAARQARVDKVNKGGNEAREALAIEKQVETQGVAARTVDQPLRMAPAPLVRVVKEGVSDASTSYVPRSALGHGEPAVLEMVAHDSLRTTVADIGNAVGKNARDPDALVKPNAGQVASDIMHGITGSTDVVLVDGVAFAPTKRTELFLQGPEYAELTAQINAPRVRGREGSVPGETIEGMGHRATEALRESARRRLYQKGRESIAATKRIAEGHGRASVDKYGEAQGPLVRGRIKWATTKIKEGTAYAVAGGKKAHEQYITSNTDLLIARSGAGSPVEEMAITADRRGIEELKQRLMRAKSNLETGKWDQARYDAELENVAEYGLFRRHPNLTTDLRAGEGTLMRGGNLEYIREGLVGDFIPVGKALVNDFVASAGDLNRYYETLSLLPELMKGPGIDTALMDQIQNPAWRMNLTRPQFAAMLRRGQFADEALGPIQFRAQATHLFALFHLTLLDADQAASEIRQIDLWLAKGEITPAEHAQKVSAAMRADDSMLRLYEYSKSIEVLLASTEGNSILGRMWKVMESRAGVPWADDFLVSETAFLETIRLGKYEIHPNLALAMIPYGPIARHLPITHGFVGHLRNMAHAVHPMFQASLPRWTDNEVINQMQVIARRKIPDSTGVMKATQIAHYVAQNYGNVLRRRRFTITLSDFQLEASYKFMHQTGKGRAGMLELRDAFIEANLGLRMNSFKQGYGSPADMEAAARKELEEDFGKMFTEPLQGGKMRREFQDGVRLLYDDLYWDMKVTHDNPGLHSVMLFNRLSDPRIARGDTWVRYVNAYWEHMTVAGAQVEAREVISTLFQSEIQRASWDAFQALGKAIDPKTGKAYAGVRIRHMDELFRKAGVMPDMERVIAQGKAMGDEQYDYSVVETEQAQRLDDLLLEDLDERALLEDDASHLYDMATVEHKVHATGQAADEYTAAAEDLARLERGTTQLDVARFNVEALETRVARLGEREVKKAAARVRPEPDATAVIAARARVIELTKEVDVVETAQLQVMEATDRVVAIEREVAELREELAEARQLGRGVSGSAAALKEALDDMAVLKEDLAAAKNFESRQRSSARLHLEGAKAELAAYEAIYAKEAAADLPPLTEPKDLKAARAKAKQARATLEAIEKHGALEDAALAKRNAARDAYEALPSKATDVEKSEALHVLNEANAELKALYDRTDISAHAVAIKGKQRPPEGRMKIAHAGFWKALKGEGGSALKAKKYLADLPDDIRPWVSGEVRQTQASQRMLKLLNGVVYQTLDIGSISVQVGKEMEEMVAVVKAMPNGPVILENWATVVHDDLLRTRLIDYVRNEDWFKAADKTIAASDITLLTAQMGELGESISKLNERIRALSPSTDPKGNKRAVLENDRNILEARRADAEELRRQLGEERPEGGTLQYGPFQKETKIAGQWRDAPPREPTADELNHGRIGMSHRALEILESMTEDQWLERELQRSYAARRRATTPKERHAAISRMRYIKRAQSVIEQSKKGPGQGPKLHANRKSYVSTASSILAERAKAAFAAKFITPYVVSAGGLEVEQGRALNRILQKASNQPVYSAVRKPGEVSKTYTNNWMEIEKRFGQAILSNDLLKKYGFPEDLFGDLTSTEFITNLDEFSRALSRNDDFAEFTVRFTKKMDKELKAMTKDPDYNIEQWMNDRLSMRDVDHFDSKRFEQIEAVVSDAIAKARQGEVRQTRTDLRRIPGELGENPLTELVEADIRAIVGKSKALAHYGIDPHAYNEARRVLRGPLVKKRYGQQIVAKANQRATDTLLSMGKKVGDKDWDSAFRKEYDKEFLAERRLMADEEAVKMLEQLAGDEMMGASYRELIEEFERRYGMDSEIRGFEPGPITPFQRRTLEEAVKTHLGVTDLKNPGQMQEGLQRHGQHPPWDDRTAMRDWLTKYGFWSPRTAEQIETGAKSWSIREEAEFYRTSWGFVPPWADPELLEKGGKFRAILFDERLRGEVYRDWGLFNRNMEARFATGKMKRAERIRLMVEGSVALGIKGQRDLAMERKYVMERFGDLAVDDAGNLIAFPELMTKDELTAFIKNTSKEDIPAGVINDVEQLEVMHQIMDIHVEKFVKEFALKGRPATFEDLFTMAANVTHDMLLDPIWLKRDRDAIGKFIRGQAAVRRALVFTQLAFMTTNVIDTMIKGPWTAFITRSFHNGPISAKARAYGVMDFGWKPHGQLLVDVPVAGLERIGEVRKGAATRVYKMPDGTFRAENQFQKGLADALQIGLGVTEVPAQVAGSAEDFMKLRLAQRMYDGVYKQALKRLGDEDLADAFARKFIGDEVNRLWPTMGNGPYEQLFNQISPFMSYQFKNHLVFLGEMAAHPNLYNFFNKLGNLMEDYNRENWEKEHPGDTPTPQELRMFEIPWAPGLFIDIGSWSDAQRGLKPLYDIANEKEGGYGLGLASQFVRLASANDINFVAGMMNAFNIGQRKEWVEIQGADGYGTGEWRQVETGWEAPWGGEANWMNSFWPVEMKTKWDTFMNGKMDGTALTLVAYQTMFFGGIKQHDRGAGLSSFFFALKAEDPAAAEEWLNTTPEGAAVQMYWIDKEPESQSWYTPQALKDILNPPKVDPNEWLHSKPEWYQAQIHSDLDGLANLRRKWDNILWDANPGTPEFHELEVQSRVERMQYYADHPELYEYFAFRMSPEEWAQQYDDWTLDDMVDTFFRIEEPKRTKGQTQVEYDKEYDKYLRSREKFLKMHPRVEERLGSARNSVEAIWHTTEDHWFDVLDRIGTRDIAIEANRQSKNYKLTDQLYLANDLDYDNLDTETAVSYFNPATDFEPLQRTMKGVPLEGPQAMRQGPFGQKLLPKITVLPDFDKWRYDRMKPGQQRMFERDRRYAEGMADVIRAAKKGKGPFDGAAFQRALKSDPWLLKQYFDRNPGKQEQWASNDAYYNQISKFGILMKQGKFDQGYEYFDNLPDWVKARYYAKHPERRGQAVHNAEYMNWMKRWTAHYKTRDYEGGADFFESMPKWVKDRYYENNPNGFGRGDGSPYSRAMGKWVKLLKANKDEEAAAYFKSLPDAFRKRYYDGHPEARIRDNIKRVGQLGEYFAADDKNRTLYLEQNPDFAKWLAKQKDDKQTRAMLIMAAYRGLPEDNQWMKRVFREKYPEIFSQEAKGKAAVQKTFAFLAEHPDMTPAFKRWYEAVLASYAEELKHKATAPKPLEVIHPNQHGVNQRTPHDSKSAAWVRLHSLS